MQEHLVYQVYSPIQAVSVLTALGRDLDQQLAAPTRTSGLCASRVDATMWRQFCRRTPFDKALQIVVKRRPSKNVRENVGKGEHAGFRFVGKVERVPCQPREPKIEPTGTGRSLGKAAEDPPVCIRLQVAAHGRRTALGTGPLRTLGPRRHAPDRCCSGSARA